MTAGTFTPELIDTRKNNSPTAKEKKSQTARNFFGKAGRMAHSQW